MTAFFDGGVGIEAVPGGGPDDGSDVSMLAAGRQPAEVARLFQVHRATISRLNAASRQAQVV